MNWFQNSISDQNLFYIKDYQNQIFYGDLVYKFKKFMGRTDFSDQFRNMIICHKRIGYNLNVMLQSACFVINSITENSLDLPYNYLSNKVIGIVSLESSIANTMMWFQTSISDQIYFHIIIYQTGLSVS